MLHYELKVVKDVVGCEIHIREANSRRILYMDTADLLAKSLDQPCLVFLKKQHLLSPQVSRAKETTPFQKVAISPSLCLEALRLLTATGRLFFQGCLLKGSWEESGTIFWRGETVGLFSPFMQGKGTEIPLQECLLLGNVCLWKETVFPFRSEVSSKWISKFLQGPLLLQGTEKKVFLEENPKILWKKEEQKQPLQIFPILQLTDMTGCFANLWMDYVNTGKVAFEDLCPTVGKQARNFSEEISWEKDLLEIGFQRKVVGNSRYYCDGSKVKEILRFLLELGWTVTVKNKKVVMQTKVLWDVATHPKGASLQGLVHFQDKQSSIASAMQQKSAWLDLDAEHVGLLNPQDWENIQGEWVQDTLLLTPSHLLQAAPLLTSSHTKWDDTLREMIEGLKGEKESFLPGEGFVGTLLPYQQKGLGFLSFLFRWGFSALLADEMGLGKTVQVLAFFSRLGKNLHALVVAPSSLLYQWQSEIQKFLPSLDTYVHVGPQRMSKVIDFQGVVITSYALLREDIDLLAKSHFEVVVLDESNAIKTSSTQTFKAALRLQSKFRIALTGTPIENREEELLSQFAFLMPGLVQKGGDLGKKVRPFMLRRTKEDVDIELPEKMEHLVWVSMNPEQEALYRSYQEKMRQGVLSKVAKDGIQAHRMEVLEGILRLRQICVDPRLVGEDIVGAKIELLCDEIGDRKVLIYSQFTKALQLVAKSLDKPFLYLDGTLSSEERAQKVMQFQEDPAMRIFLLSLKAGGTGLNLTEAEGVFLLDPWWNDAVENQAIARAHRLGQKKSVIVKKYLMLNTIEEKMLRLKERKQELAEHLFSGASLDDCPSNLTEEDLCHLLM